MQALGRVWETLAQSGRNLREIRTPLCEPTLHGARLLLEIWWDRQHRGGIVMGRDLPSRALVSILGNLAVFEPLEGGSDYRVRLAGAAFLRRFAREISGLRLTEFVSKAHVEDHLKDIAGALSMGAPVVQHVRVANGEKTLLEYEALHLRILAPRGVAGWVLGGVFYKDWP